MERKQFVRSWEDPDCFAHEPIFVPKPGISNEDEEDAGVLVFPCHGANQTKPETSLVILDAGQLQELGRFTVPTITTTGFHGIWLDSYVPAASDE